MIWTPRVTVAAVVARDDAYLMVEEDTAQGRVYNQPAGHLEDRETLLDAVIRETREETGWGFAPESLVGIYRWRMSAPVADNVRPGEPRTYLRVCFAGTAYDHDPRLRLDAGIVRAAWIPRAELMDAGMRLRSPMVLRCIRDYEAGHRYPLALLNEIDTDS